jgi:putative ABC transport system permease protein
MAPPLAEFSPSTAFAVDGGTEFVGGANYNVVSPDYFRAIGIPLRRGRAFAPSDGPGAEHVVVVNETAARRYWPGGSPLGHRVRFPGMDKHVDVWLTIVGVVGDVRQHGPEQPADAEMYVSYRQRPERLAHGGTLVVRGAVPPALLGPAVRGVVRAADPEIPVTLSTMEEALGRVLQPRRTTTTVLTALGALALLLAAVGVYGVLSYTVARRQRELSVRLARGAQPRDRRRRVLRDAARAVLPGLAAGVLGALLLTRQMQSLVFGVRANDPVALAAAALLLLAVALVASYVPAWRATRADPLLAMRGE